VVLWEPMPLVHLPRKFSIRQHPVVHQLFWPTVSSNSPQSATTAWPLWAIGV